MSRSGIRLAILGAMMIILVGVAGSSGAVGPGDPESKTAVLDLAVVPGVVPERTPVSLPATAAARETSFPTVEGLPDLADFVPAGDTEHFYLYAEPDSHAWQNVDDFGSEAELLLQEMASRVEGDLGQRASFYLYSSGRRDFGALSFFSPPLIYLEYGARSSPARTKALIGHELTHLIANHSLGYPDSLVLLEGIAHWASEPYWTSAVGESFDRRVRRSLTRSRVLPLAALSSDRSLWRGATQLLAYDESGSFVGYLIRLFGLGQFKRVYQHANYEEVYGKSLEDLQSDWLAFVRENEDAVPDPLRQLARQLAPTRAAVSP